MVGSPSETHIASSGGSGRSESGPGLDPRPPRQPIGGGCEWVGPIGEDNEFVLGPGTHTIRAEAFYPGGTKNFVATFTIESP